MSQPKKVKKVYRDPIKVGSFMYRIKWVSRLEDHGVTLTDDKVIKINTSYPEQVIKDTLLHELQHAIYDDTYAFDDTKDTKSEDKEEKTIRIFTPRFMQVMLDNPKLVDYLFKRNDDETN